MRLVRIAGSWWRIEAKHPDDWTWAPFPTPRNRFDPMSGRFRVRYAANRPAVAARERFPGRLITPVQGEYWLVELGGGALALPLTRQANLDTLRLDDRISTGRIDVDRRSDPDPLLGTCASLADAVYDWWGGRPPPLVYRSRTTPGVGRNL
ncbi:MAG TPA: RES domain-containing protein, partial [Acidimicrobiales bacterium]|nr:RES domain-containing protein [Acidimicrobiales bacterium]